jgi:hypothetical protein
MSPSRDTVLIQRIVVTFGRCETTVILVLGWWRRGWDIDHSDKLFITARRVPWDYGRHWICTTVVGSGGSRTGFRRKNRGLGVECLGPSFFYIREKTFEVLDVELFFLQLFLKKGDSRTMFLEVTPDIFFPRKRKFTSWESDCPGWLEVSEDTHLSRGDGWSRPMYPSHTMTVWSQSCFLVFVDYVSSCVSITPPFTSREDQLTVGSRRDKNPIRASGFSFCCCFNPSCLAGKPDLKKSPSLFLLSLSLWGSALYLLHWEFSRLSSCQFHRMYKFSWAVTLKSTIQQRLITTSSKTTQSVQSWTIQDIFSYALSQ